MSSRVKIVTPKLGKVRIGIPSGITTNKGTSLDDIAKWIEFGTISQPARAFMMRTLFEAKEDKQIKKLLFSDQNKCGEQVKNLMQFIMESENFTPLKQSTLKSRRSRGNFSKQPTVDTGLLKDSITSEVIPNDKG